MKVFLRKPLQSSFKLPHPDLAPFDIPATSSDHPLSQLRFSTSGNPGSVTRSHSGLRMSELRTLSIQREAVMVRPETFSQSADADTPSLMVLIQKCVRWISRGLVANLSVVAALLFTFRQASVNRLVVATSSSLTPLTPRSA